jgi:CRISPR-associated endonuclease/helicase Cas3
VVTTNVQLFESLFKGLRAIDSHIRRRLRAIIIRQRAVASSITSRGATIPFTVLRPRVAALDELARYYRVSIVMSTANQAGAEVGGRI